MPYGDLPDEILDNPTRPTSNPSFSARLYVEYKGAFFNDFKISVPTAVFPEEAPQAPRSRPSGFTHPPLQEHLRAALRGLGTAGLFVSPRRVKSLR